MAKLLFFLLLGVLIYRLLHGQRSAPPRPRPPRPAGEDMVACAHCGLHVPIGESVESDGRRYCCQDHLKLHADGRR